MSFFASIQVGDDSDEENDICTAIKRSTAKAVPNKAKNDTNASSPSNGNSAPFPHQPSKMRKHTIRNFSASVGTNATFATKLATELSRSDIFKDNFCSPETDTDPIDKKVRETLPDNSTDKPRKNSQDHDSAISAEKLNHADLGSHDDVVFVGLQERNTPMNQGSAGRRTNSTDLQKTNGPSKVTSNMSSLEKRAHEKILAMKKRVLQAKLKNVAQPFSLAERAPSVVNPSPVPQSLLPSTSSIENRTQGLKTGKAQKTSSSPAQTSPKRGDQEPGRKPTSKPAREGSTLAIPRHTPVPSNFDPNISNAELFKHFASQVPTKRTTQLVGPLPEPLTLAQRRKAHEVEKRSNRDLNHSLAVVSKGPRQIPAGQRVVLPEPLLPSPPPPRPPRPPTRTRTVSAQKARQKVRRPSLSPAPTVSSEGFDAPNDTPKATQGVCAEKVLGESGLIFQYVSNRTRFFDPQQTTREAMRVRGNAFLSKIKAAEDVRKWYERRVKSVIGKQFSISDGYFSGVVRFADGLEQHFWVSQEIKDLRTLNQKRRKEDKSKLMIDPSMARVYRERYDVISHRAYPKYELDKPKPSVIYHDEEDDDDDDDDDDSTRSAEDQSFYESYRVDETFKHPADFVDWEFEVHNSFVDLECANGYAFKMFEMLAKPKNYRLADKEAYNDFLRDLQAHHGQFNLKKDMADLEWAPPLASEGYRWEFVKLHVKVHKTQLHGPMDIGDMVVDIEMMEVGDAANVANEANAGEENEDERALDQAGRVEDRLDADGDCQMSESESVASEEL